MADDKYLPNKANDSERKAKQLQERQDKMLADLRKREKTPIIKDSSLSTSDGMRIKSSNLPIDTKGAQKILSGSDFTSKINALRGLGKKAMGVIPLAGVGYAAMSGDPAMAAEEAAGDLIPGYETIKSDSAGMSPEDESIMLAEDKARKSYDKSPARLGKLESMMKREPAQAVPEMEEMPRETTGLAMDEVPEIGAQAMAAEDIAPAMNNQIVDKLLAAEQISPEQMRMIRIRRLFNPQG